MPVATQRCIVTWAPASIYMQYLFDLLGMFYDVYIFMLHAVLLLLLN
jgi:hypothetical protein